MFCISLVHLIYLPLVFTRIQTRESVSKVITLSTTFSSGFTLVPSPSGSVSLHDRPQSGFTGYSELYFSVSGALGWIRERNYNLRLVASRSLIGPSAYRLFLPWDSLDYDLLACVLSHLDGAGIFCGIIKHLVSRGVECPKVLAATHFHEVFNSNILDPHSLPITFAHMQVLFTSKNGEVIAASDAQEQFCLESDIVEDENETTDDSQSRVGPGERITYLYRCVPTLDWQSHTASQQAWMRRVEKGLWLNSHAALCAEIYGMPRQVVNRARYVRWVTSLPGYVYTTQTLVRF